MSIHLFLNDIFYNISGLYNYADDNTISIHGDSVAIVKERLEDATNCALKWFSNNEMQANPSKFQALLLGSNSENSNVSFNVGDTAITPSKSVNLLGVEIDNKLNFSIHAFMNLTKCLRNIVTWGQNCLQVKNLFRFSIFVCTLRIRIFQT